MFFAKRRARKAAARAATEVHSLLDAASAQAQPVEQALWIIDLLDWLRRGPDADRLREGLNLPPALAAQDGEDTAAPAEIRRLQTLLDVLDHLPERRAEIAAVIDGLLRNTDATLLLADFGFSQRPSFFSEFGERLGNKWLPKSPETRDLAVLFALFFPQAHDAVWLEALD
ncbi:MAG: site-specific recombinase Gcr, partial [Thiomonas sp. 14-64-326]